LYRDAFVNHHKVIGAWDSNFDAAARAAADLGTLAHDTAASCVAAKPDLAYVLGVHAAMPGICRELIAARVPLVLEKPGTAAVAELAAVRDEAKAAGVAATVALVQRYGPLPDLLSRMGALRHVRTRRGSRGAATWVASGPSRSPRETDAEAQNGASGRPANAVTDRHTGYRKA
jgi:predicted dehydrogenase